MVLCHFLIKCPKMGIGFVSQYAVATCTQGPSPYGTVLWGGPLVRGRRPRRPPAESRSGDRLRTRGSAPHNWVRSVILVRFSPRLSGEPCLADIGFVPSLSLVHPGPDFGFVPSS